MGAPLDLYDVAKKVTLSIGLPYTDPRTGITTQPKSKPCLQKAAQTEPSWAEIAKKTIADRAILKRLIRESPENVETELHLYYAELKERFRPKKKKRKAKR
jgi:hypothetical protein